MTNEEIRAKLFDLSDAKFKEFSSTLTPCEQKMIGVRVPLVKEMAKVIAKGNYKEYLINPYTEYHEESLLYGLVIGYLKTDIDELLKIFDSWLPCVKNWAVCDSSVMNIKALGSAGNKPRVWEYLNNKLAATTEPYTIRAIIVALFCYFLDGQYLSRVVKIFESIKGDHYYIRMALAWGVSVIAVKNYPAALQMFIDGNLDKWVHNKAIQKSCESFRLSQSDKQQMRQLKIK